MSTSVHHSLMYNQGQRQQQDTPAGPLSNQVTPVVDDAWVPAGPATFSSGLAPSTLKELRKYSVNADFSSGSNTDWDVNQYAELPTGKKYLWFGPTGTPSGWIRIEKPVAPTAVEGSIDVTGGSEISWTYSGTSTDTYTNEAIINFIIKAYTEDPEAEGEYTIEDSTQSADGDINPIIFTGLTNRTLYTFTVTAVTAAGEGPESAPSAPVDIYSD